MYSISFFIRREQGGEMEILTDDDLLAPRLSPAFNRAAEPIKPTPDELREAAERGDVKALKEMLPRMSDIDVKSGMVGDTALMAAIRAQHYDAAKVLLEAGANPDIPDNLLIYPIGIALSNLAEEAVDMLLAHKASPNVVSATQTYPIIIAAEAGLDGVVEKLIAHKAWLNLPDDSGVTAALAAVVHGHESTLRILKKHGASLDVRDSQDLSLLDHVIWKQRNDRMFDLLVELGADVHKADPNRTSHVHRAAEADNEHAMGRLIAMKADITRPNGHGLTPLIVTAVNGSGKTAKMLLDQGVPLEGPHAERHSPRRHAELKGHAHIVDLIDAEAGKRVQASILAEMKRGTKGGTTALRPARFKKQDQNP